MVIHLELRLLMRRVECIRLTRQDVQFGLLHVRGKGRMGGKWRTLAWAPEYYQPRLKLDPKINAALLLERRRTGLTISEIAEKAFRDYFSKGSK